jgi:DNA-binding NarL/FixJ family response regulator
MAAITVVVADDHPVVRQGTRNLLAVEPDIAIVGEAEDGLSAVELVSRLQPDILVLDMILPKMAGLEVMQQVNHCSLRTRVIAFSMCDDEEYVWLTFQNGAAAYVLKDAAADELVTAIREVAAGRRYLCPPLPDLADNAGIPQDNSASRTPQTTLTAREHDVLRLVARGQTNMEIAAELSLSERTVAHHVEHVMGKLGVSNRMAAVAHAVQCGWLEM